MTATDKHHNYPEWYVKRREELSLLHRSGKLPTDQYHYLLDQNDVDLEVHLEWFLDDIPVPDVEIFDTSSDPHIVGELLR